MEVPTDSGTEATRLPGRPPENYPPYPDAPHARGGTRIKNDERRDVYLGKHGSWESVGLYFVFMLEWHLTGKSPPKARAADLLSCLRSSGSLNTIEASRRGEQPQAAEHGDPPSPSPSTGRAGLIAVAISLVVLLASCGVTHVATKMAYEGESQTRVTTNKPVVPDLAAAPKLANNPAAQAIMALEAVPPHQRESVTRQAAVISKDPQALKDWHIRNVRRGRTELEGILDGTYDSSLQAAPRGGD